MDNQVFLTVVGFGEPEGAQGSGERVALFSATSDGTATNSLDGNDPAGLQVDVTTDTFIIGGWVKVNTIGVAGVRVIFTNGDNTADSQYYSLEMNDEGTVRIRMISTAASTASAGSIPNLTEGVAAFVLGWWDGTELHIKINAEAAVDAGVIPALPTPTGEIRVFANTDATNGFNGTLDEWFFCKNPPDMSAALTLIGSTIYAAGSGTHYANLSAANHTTLGLVSWWGFDEAAGATRLDLHGDNDLTLNGTITQTDPLAN